MINRRLAIAYAGIFLMATISGATMKMCCCPSVDSETADAIKEVIEPTEEIIYGNKIGDYCYSSSLEIVEANGPTGRFVDPTGAGVPTILYFWGTWCTPTVNELPMYEELAAQYINQIQVYAIHSTISRETANAFIAEYYNNSHTIFLLDNVDESSSYYNLLQGMVYPYTIVLNAEGNICDVFQGSVTYDQLHESIENAMYS